MVQFRPGRFAAHTIQTCCEYEPDESPLTRIRHSLLSFPLNYLEQNSTVKGLVVKDVTSVPMTSEVISSMGSGATTLVAVQFSVPDKAQ